MVNPLPAPSSLNGALGRSVAKLKLIPSAGVAVPLVNYHNGWGADTVAPERKAPAEGVEELEDQAREDQHDEQANFECHRSSLTPATRPAGS